MRWRGQAAGTASEVNNTEAIAARRGGGLRSGAALLALLGGSLSSSFVKLWESLVTWISAYARLLVFFR